MPSLSPLPSLSSSALSAIRANYSYPPIIEAAIARAFGGYLENYALSPDSPMDDPAEFLQECHPVLMSMLRKKANRHRAVLLWSCLHVTMDKIDGSELTPCFTHKRHYIFPKMDIEVELASLFAQILKNQEDFQERGSGWVVKNVERLEIHMSAYVPLTGRSYVPLPIALTRKRAIVNIKNEDNQCFKWCVLAYLHYVPGCQNPNDLYHYRPYTDDLDFTGIPFPVPITSIPLFETLNDISVNVYGFSNTLYPLYLSQEPREHHIHMVYYKGHYTIVRDLDRLLHHENNNRTKKWFCDRCLVPQYSEERLTDHRTRCKTENPQRVMMSREKTLCFKNYRRQQRAPLVIYADFECLEEKIEHPAPDPNQASTTYTQKHIPCGFAMYPVMSCCPGHPGGTVQHEPTVYRGPDCVSRFLTAVMTLAEQYNDRLNDPAPLNMTRDDQAHHNSTDQCHICEESIAVGDQKDRDHCHVCGRYRGPAHGKCNRDYRVIRDVSVVFHNSRNYDSHIMMRELGGVCNERGYRIRVIPKGLEDYLGFMLFRSKKKGPGGVIAPPGRDVRDHQETMNQRPRARPRARGVPRVKRPRCEFLDDMAEASGGSEDEEEEEEHGEDEFNDFINDSDSDNDAPGPSHDRPIINPGWSFFGQRSQDLDDSRDDADDDVVPEEDVGDMIDGGDQDGPENPARTRWCIRFVDSCQYLPEKLEKLVNGLDKVNGFAHMKEIFGSDNGGPGGNRVDLLLRKGVYPYEYMDSWDRFDEDHIPPQQAFYSTLNDTAITDEDHTHANRVWEVFGCQNMGDYHDLYLKTDVVLLADVVETFRTNGMKTYGLDPLHYFTLPSYSWDAFLRHSKVVMELLQDQEMYVFIEAGIRGGVAMISLRRATANNPMADSEWSPYDPTKPHTWILYIDANNLYGWAMSQKLPLSDFQWVDVSEHPFFCRFEKTDGDWGYVVEVDIEYPEELHELHNGFPLAPERMVITDDMLSPYARNLKVAMGQPLGKGPKVEKLVPNLRHKKNYIVNLRTLQYYMSQGLEITDLHRVLKYKQAPFMKSYIELNTALRTAATTDFEKDQYKLMNNAVFGKTMENVRQYKDIVLITKQAQYRRLAKDPLYIRSSIFTDDLVAVHRRKHTVTLDKPVHIGQAILDISKELVADMYHGHMIPRYGPEKCKLIGTDTDSLLFFIETPDVYKDMAETPEKYDFSNYPTDHPLYSVANKKVPGLWKDELGGAVAHEVIALKAKMYSILCPGGKEMKRAKGVKKYVVEKTLRHQHYVDVLESSGRMRHSMNMFRNDRHEIFTTTINKISISAFDDKRALHDDGIGSDAYGYKDPKENDNGPVVNDNDDNERNDNDDMWRPWE